MDVLAISQLVGLEIEYGWLGLGNVDVGKREI